MADNTLLKFVDVAKTYYHINLFKLEEIIREMNPPPDVLMKWEDKFQDLQVLNMDVSGVCIKRRNRLPQGSELAPGLFNIYITYILEHLNISHEVENALFAGN